MIDQIFSPWLAVGVLVLLVVLVVITYVLRRTDRRYETHSVKETLSDEMKTLIQQEREENLVKKEKFDEALRKADLPPRSP